MSGALSASEVKGNGLGGAASGPAKALTTAPATDPGRFIETLFFCLCDTPLCRQIMKPLCAPPQRGFHFFHFGFLLKPMLRQFAFFPDTGPDFTFEEKMGGRVAGLDEAGRGPLAGPVVAAAVILAPGAIPRGLNDSKKLTAKRRGELFGEILVMAEVGIGEASVSEIDKINILQATMLAMRRAIETLNNKPDGCLVDGNTDPRLELPTRCIIKGDALSLSIAAASIIAKVTRDKLMTELAQDYPAYGWETNAGYGVPYHLKALAKVGISPHHRKSFSPIRDLNSGEKVARA